MLLFFVDGLGLGSDDAAVNPLVTAHMPALRSLLGKPPEQGRPLTRSAVPYRAGKTAIVATDPRLGVKGLPQSATGQTAIFTGVNAAQAIGRHLNGYPTPSLKAILGQHSIFRWGVERGLRVTFLNPFPEWFFEWVAAGQPRPTDRRWMPSASTVATLAGGVDCFRTIAQLRAGDAVSMDIDHHLLREWQGIDIEPVDPAEAGRRAARIAGEHDFTLYEHFLTDKAGHSQDFAAATAALERVDRFLGGLLAHLPDDVLLLITSDHGNIEDLTVKTHTYHDVPTICHGPGAAEAADRAQSLLDITPLIQDYLSRNLS